jgi:hypothetical protein
MRGSLEKSDTQMRELQNMYNFRKDIFYQSEYVFIYFFLNRLVLLMPNILALKYW